MEDFARKHFKSNVHAVWKKELKKINNSIDALEEKKIPKAEEALEKAEEKGNKTLIDKEQAKLDNLEAKLK